MTAYMMARQSATMGPHLAKVSSFAACLESFANIFLPCGLGHHVGAGFGGNHHCVYGDPVAFLNAMLCSTMDECFTDCVLFFYFFALLGSVVFSCGSKKVLF